MSDKQTRQAERDAADDAQAAERVRHERCRLGECCAHAGETVLLGEPLCASRCWVADCRSSFARLRNCVSREGLCGDCCDAHACADAVPPGEGGGE